MPFPFLAAAVLGGAGLSSYSAHREASMNRAFQADQSGTAYQRAVMDMKAAGLNPMLAYQQGGASTASGSRAEVPDFGAAMSSAVQSSRTRAETKLLEAQAAKVIAETPGAEAESSRIRFIVDNMLPVEFHTKQSERHLRSIEEEVRASGLPYEKKAVIADAMLREMGMPAKLRQLVADALLSELEIPKGRAYADYYKGAGRAEPYAAGIGKVLSGAADARRSMGYQRRYK